MLVRGVSGPGKSFLIETIDQLTSEIWPSGGMTCAIATPTGLAAFNVDVMTLHRLFQMPIEREGKTSMYRISANRSTALLLAHCTLRVDKLAQTRFDSYVNNSNI